MNTFAGCSAMYRLARTVAYTLAVSAMCLVITTVHADDNVRPAIKPRAAATITPWPWSNNFPEDDHRFTCADGVMIGRAHDGDENGDTRYRCGEVHQFEKLIPIEHFWTGSTDENDFTYECPQNYVMTGRYHYGDENGSTQYQCASLKDAWGNVISVVPGSWTEVGEESGSSFECSENQVMVGRGHKGDENGDTKYKCAVMW